LRLVNTGASFEQLLLLGVNEVNDVPNAVRATVMTPRDPDENETFRQGVRLLGDLQSRGKIELAVSTREVAEGSSDPVPASAVQGRDLLNAQKDGYVFRASGTDHVTLRKREKGLVLRVRPDSVNSAEMLELARIFRLGPGLSTYWIKSELTEDQSESMPGALGNDTIYLNMRSILQMGTFLSKGVCVPEEHICKGIAPVTHGPDGRPYDWRGVTAGLFVVHSGRHRPHKTEVAVHYRDYWYWIEPDDVSSRASLAIFELLSGLQEADDRTPGPLLTLPVGG
jgi:hypothetical protein